MRVKLLNENISMALFNSVLRNTQDLNCKYVLRNFLYLIEESN